MKILSPRVHGVIDYLFAALFLLAPWLLSLSGLPATLCDVIAAIHLTMALCTAYPAGVVRAVPFAAHGWFELFEGVTLTIAPWIFGFGAADAPRSFFIGAGALLLLAWVGTEYQVPLEKWGEGGAP